MIKNNLFIFIVLLFQISFANPNDTKTLPVDSKKEEACFFSATIKDKKLKDEYPIQLCMYTHTETRGIFAATACVAVLVETQSGQRHPFYGSKGHWGIEGACEGKKISDKFKEPQTMTTVNPISDIKMKRKLGKTLEINVDHFGLGKQLLDITKP